MSTLPLAAAGPLWAFTIEGRPERLPGETAWSARYLTVMPGVFQALRIPLERGRLLDESDVAERPFVAVINETAGRLYWAGDDPIGRTIRFGARPRESIHIVGIVGDIRSLGPGEPAPPAVYLPLAQSGPPPAMLGRVMQFVIRTSGNPTDLAVSARGAVASVDPALPLVGLRPMSEVASAASGQPRFTTLVMSVFAGMAFFLAALGLYGILAYSVEQRTHEIGVRVALGASRGRILSLVLGDAARIMAIGVAVGGVLALAAGRAIGSMLFGLAPGDVMTLVIAAGVLSVAGFLSAMWPAKRAAGLDPVSALRES
jgi:putative ABC transport system permease protein